MPFQIEFLHSHLCLYAANRTQCMRSKPLRHRHDLKIILHAETNLYRLKTNNSQSEGSLKRKGHEFAINIGHDSLFPVNDEYIDSLLFYIS